MAAWRNQLRPAEILENSLDMRMKGMKKTKGRTSIQDLENSLESIMPSGSMEIDFISLNLELLLCLQYQRSLLLL